MKSLMILLFIFNISLVLLNFNVFMINMANGKTIGVVASSIAIVFCGTAAAINLMTFRNIKRREKDHAR